MKRATIKSANDREFWDYDNNCPQFYSAYVECDGDETLYDLVEHLAQYGFGCLFCPDSFINGETSDTITGDVADFGNKAYFMKELRKHVAEWRKA